MNQVIVDAALRSKLHDLSRPFDLCDEAGKVVAHVIPALNPDDWEPTSPPELSPEELRRRKESKKWYTSVEVLKHLESLP